MLVFRVAPVCPRKMSWPVLRSVDRFCANLWNRIVTQLVIPHRHSVLSDQGAGPVLGTASIAPAEAAIELPIILQNALILFCRRDPGRSANGA